MGEGLSSVLESSHDTVKEMHQQWYVARKPSRTTWRCDAFTMSSVMSDELRFRLKRVRPWFRTLIDLLEMILVKSETRVAANYDRQLVFVPLPLCFFCVASRLNSRLSDNVVVVPYFQS